jgi:acetyl-CoA carboxylase biotin carboxyl carrier protein
VAVPFVPPAPTAAANTKKIVAPIIGVFYSAPSPGAEPFVNVGDRVSVGQVLCILEAMKLMNEITSDYAGVVRRVLPENGALVSLGEEMFWIEP